MTFAALACLCVSALVACNSAVTNTPAAAPSSPLNVGKADYAADGPCTAPKGTTPFRQAQNSASAGATWVWVGMDQGVWVKCGFDLEVPEVSSTGQVSLYLANQLNFGSVGGGFPATVAATGRPMSVYGLIGTASPMQFLVQPSINSAVELKGKVVAVLSPVDTTYALAQYYLKKQGIDPKDVKFSYVTSTANIQAALASGAASGGVISHPAADIAVAHGAKVLYEFTTDTALKRPVQPIVGNPSWVANNPEHALNILRAIIASIWITKAKPDLARASIVKHAAKFGLDPKSPDYQLSLDATVDTATKVSYSDPKDILTVSSDVLSLLKDTAPQDVQAKLTNVDMQKYAPVPDLGAQLLQDGFLEHLEELYGPLPTN